MVPAAATARLGPSISRLRTRPARTWRASGPPREALCCFFWPRRGSRRWRGAWLRAVRVSSRGSHGRGIPSERLSAPRWRGAGGGVRAPPDPRAAWTLAGPGAQGRGGTQRPLPFFALSALEIFRTRGVVTWVRGLAVSPPRQGPLALPDPAAWPGSLSESREVPGLRIVLTGGRDS